MKWFHFSVTFLKNTSVKPTNTTSVITSWITFRCSSENGPPFSE